jgi:hypothetical protein
VTNVTFSLISEMSHILGQELNTATAVMLLKFFVPDIIVAPKQEFVVICEHRTNAHLSRESRETLELCGDLCHFTWPDPAPFIRLRIRSHTGRN